MRTPVRWDWKSFWDPTKNSRKNIRGLADCLATSSRPSDQQQRRPNGRTLNVGVVIRTAVAYTLCLKKVPTFKLSVTLSDLNRFWKILIFQGSVAICLRWSRYCHTSFVANFIRFQQCIIFENRLRFDKVTESSKVRTFSRDNVVGLKSILSNRKQYAYVCVSRISSQTKYITCNVLQGSVLNCTAPISYLYQWYWQQCSR